MSRPLRDRPGDSARDGGISRVGVRVRYPETDQMGVAHHSHFFVWFEIGRTELMREAGCAYARLEESGISMPVVEATCRYRNPARYDDLVSVETRLERATRAGVRFGYRVVRDADGRLLATGMSRHAATDRDGGLTRLPPELLDRLRPFASA